MNFQPNGRDLAHTFYPARPNPESIAGDMHLNADLEWAEGGNPDLFSLTLHELGHALGLGHSDDVDSIMYPVYRRTQALSQSDIAAIRRLYATKHELSVRVIESPESAIQEATWTLRAVVEGGNGGAVTVTWKNGLLGEGEITSGERNFSIPDIPLEVGLNTIEVQVKDAQGTIAQATLVVERVTSASGPPDGLPDGNKVLEARRE
jgi:hypothetical protein